MEDENKKALDATMRVFDIILGGLNERIDKDEKGKEVILVEVPEDYEFTRREEQGSNNGEYTITLKFKFKNKAEYTVLKDFDIIHQSKIVRINKGAKVYASNSSEPQSYKIDNKYYVSLDFIKLNKEYFAKI